MIITVQVKPNAKHLQSVALKDDIYIVTTKAAAIEGKANVAVQKLLADYFNIPKTNVQLIRGTAAHIKTFEIVL